MKNLIISIILLYSVALVAQDDIIVDTNITTASDKVDVNITTTQEILDTNNTNIVDINNEIVQIEPTINTLNLNSKDDDAILIDGNATKNLTVEVVFLHNSNERVVETTQSNEDGYWSITKDSMMKQLDDGSYDIFVSSKDINDNKSAIVSKKGVVKDTTIHGKIAINDGDKIRSDRFVNLAELDSVYISGKIDLDSHIDSIKIFNKDDINNTIVLDLTNIDVDSEGIFHIYSSNIDLSSLNDGDLKVVMDISDNFDNRLTAQDTIVKDTTKPNKPEILKYVKDKNMIYGKVANLLVFGGVAELDSTIEVRLHNLDNKEIETMATVKTDTSMSWTVTGKDLDIANLKDGMIESILIQIDKAGNRSEPLFFVTKKEKSPIFPISPKIIPTEDYMSVFTIHNLVDKIKSVTVTDDYIIAGSYELLYYFDKQKGQKVKEIEIKDNWINSIVQDNNKLILALSNGDIQIRETATGNLLETLKGHKTPVLFLALDKEKKYLVSSSSNGDVIVWDLESSNIKYTLKKHQWDVSAIAIANDEIYTGSDDYTIKMWDLKTGNLIKSLKSAHKGTINALIVYKDKLISASDDKLIHIRDLKTGQIITTLKGHKRGVTALTINHDTLISASKDRSLILWDLKTNEKVKQLRGHSKTITSIAVNDENIVTGSMDYKVKVWGYDLSLQGQGEVDETVLAKYDLIKTMELSSDEIRALAQTENEIVIGTKGYVLFFNNVTYQYTRSYTTLDEVVKPKKDDKKESSDDEWGDEEDSEDDAKESSDDDGWEDSGSSDGDEVSGWEEELEKKKEARIALAKTQLQWINDIDIRGTQLTAALGFNNLKIWNLETNKATALLEGHESSVLSITRDESNIVTTSADGAIKVWDDEALSLKMSIDAHQWDVRSSVVDDGKIYSVSDDYSIKIWDMETGELIKVIKAAHNLEITKVLVYKNNLITSSLDGTIKYRDKVTGKLLKVLKGHKEGVNTMVMDDTHLVSASQDNTIKVWDLETGELITTMKHGHTLGISSLMITDDYIISGGKDKKITIWKYYE